MNQETKLYSQFYGFKEVTVDAKGRVVIPKIFHEELLQEGGNTLSISMDVKQQCVTIVTKARWEMQCEALTTDKTVDLDIKRLKLGTHDWVEMDGTGRILVPKTLRTMAEIERDALINGIGTRLELWNRDLFSKYYASIRERSQQKDKDDDTQTMSASKTIHAYDL